MNLHKVIWFKLELIIWIYPLVLSIALPGLFLNNLFYEKNVFLLLNADCSSAALPCYFKTMVHLPQDKPYNEVFLNLFDWCNTRINKEQIGRNMCSHWQQYLRFECGFWWLAFRWCLFSFVSTDAWKLCPKEEQSIVLS